MAGGVAVNERRRISDRPVVTVQLDKLAILDLVVCYNTRRLSSLKVAKSQKSVCSDVSSVSLNGVFGTDVDAPKASQSVFVQTTFVSFQKVGLRLRQQDLDGHCTL